MTTSIASTITISSFVVRHRVAVMLSGVVALVVVAWLISAGLASAAPGDSSGGTWNPLDGVKPDFSLFGPTVGTTWRRVVGAFWAACLGICAVWIIKAGATFAMARNRGMVGQVNAAKSDLLDAALGLGLCVSSFIIIGAVIFVFGV